MLCSTFFSCILLPASYVCIGRINVLLMWFRCTFDLAPIPPTTSKHTLLPTKPQDKQKRPGSSLGRAPVCLCRRDTKHARRIAFVLHHSSSKIAERERILNGLGAKAFREERMRVYIVLSCCRIHFIEVVRRVLLFTFHTELSTRSPLLGPFFPYVLR